MSPIDELENRLDTLTTAILPPLRATKHVDRQAMDQLNQLVDDLASEVGDAPAIPRRLTGKLWFIFTQMLSEADHARSPEEILYSAWRLPRPAAEAIRPLVRARTAYTRHTQILTTPARVIQDHDLRLEY